MHPNELMQKLSMKGDIEVTEELVGMLKAIHEGRPIIIDEIDTIPTPTLMSIKSLFTIKSGKLFAPQGGTGQTLYEAGRAPMVIATMNGRSAKHETRVSMDPAILRLF